jgi:hypothetical protein
MVDYPHPNVAGVLSFLFLRKLCDRLERDNKLAPGETRRLWAKIVAELEPQRSQATIGNCLDEIARLKLT